MRCQSLRTGVPAGACSPASQISDALATSVRVRVAAEGEGSVTCEVVDDGTGLVRAHGRGLGLRSMLERAAELGGELEVVRRDDRPGTRVRMVLP